jgi:hypothetical protein
MRPKRRDGEFLGCVEHFHETKIEQNSTELETQTDDLKPRHPEAAGIQNYLARGLAALRTSALQSFHLEPLIFVGYRVLHQRRDFHQSQRQLDDNAEISFLEPEESLHRY